MKSNPEYLLSLADQCDNLGFHKIADDLDDLIRTGSFTKVAQYVGFMGYIHRSIRNIQNCQRRKGAESSRPRQEIVLECLKEYQDGISNFYDDKWVRYASNEDSTRYMNELIKAAIFKDIPIASVIRKFAEAIASQNDLDADIEKLNAVWGKIKEASLDKNKNFEEFEKIMKQAGMWDAVKGIGKGIANIGKGVVNWGLYQKRYASFVQYQTQTIQEILAAANVFNQTIQSALAVMPANSPARQTLETALQKGNINEVQAAINQAFTALQNPAVAPAAAAPTSTGAPAPASTGAPEAHGEAMTGMGSVSPNIYRYIYGQRMGEGTEKQQMTLLKKAMQELQKIPALVQALYTNMEIVSQEPRFNQTAAQEIAAMNQSIQAVSQSPLNVQTVNKLNTDLQALDAKLRNSLFQQQQQQQQQQAPAAAGATEGTGGAADTGTIPLEPGAGAGAGAGAGGASVMEKTKAWKQLKDLLVKVNPELAAQVEKALGLDSPAASADEAGAADTVREWEEAA